MTKIRIVTGFSPAGYKQYGKAAMETFDKYWEEGIELQAYCEEPTDIPRNGYRNLSECVGCIEFINRHKVYPQRCGTEHTPRWEPKHFRAGYCFRTDVVKFCRQAYIPYRGMRGLDTGDYLIWIDGDVITHDHVTKEFLVGLFDDNDIIYLGREGYHTELGFWGVKIGPITKHMLWTFRDIYETDAVLTLPEWHSAFVWDYCRTRVKATEWKQGNLTPGGRGHVWDISPLADVTEHLKGKRKDDFAAEYAKEGLK